MLSAASRLAPVRGLVLDDVPVDEDGEIARPYADRVDDPNVGATRRPPRGCTRSRLRRRAARRSRPVGRPALPRWRWKSCYRPMVATVGGRLGPTRQRREMPGGGDRVARRGGRKQQRSGRAHRSTGAIAHRLVLRLLRDLRVLWIALRAGVAAAIDGGLRGHHRPGVDRAVDLHGGARAGRAGRRPALRSRRRWRRRTAAAAVRRDRAADRCLRAAGAARARGGAAPLAERGDLPLARLLSLDRRVDGAEPAALVRVHGRDLSDRHGGPPVRRGCRWRYPAAIQLSLRRQPGGRGRRSHAATLADRGPGLSRHAAPGCDPQRFARGGRAAARRLAGGPDHAVDSRPRARGAATGRGRGRGRQRRRSRVARAGAAAAALLDRAHQHGDGGGLDPASSPPISAPWCTHSV